MQGKGKKYCILLSRQQRPKYGGVSAYTYKRAELGSKWFYSNSDRVWEDVEL